jgi:hypothetical protein
MKKLKKSNESGVAIILALIFLAIFMILAFAFTARSVAASRSATYQSGELQAQANCELALEYAIASIKAQSTDTSVASSLPEASWSNPAAYEKASGSVFKLPSNKLLTWKYLANQVGSYRVANNFVFTKFMNEDKFSPDSSSLTWAPLSTPDSVGDASRSNLAYTWYALPISGLIDPNHCFEKTINEISRSTISGTTFTEGTLITPYTETTPLRVVRTGYTDTRDNPTYYPEIRAKAITPNWHYNDNNDPLGFDWKKVYWKSAQQLTDYVKNTSNLLPAEQDSAFTLFYPLDKLALPAKKTTGLFDLSLIDDDTSVDTIVDGIPCINNMPPVGSNSRFQRQLAANIKDYIDNDDWPTTDATDYCGLEKQPTFNEISYAIENISTYDAGTKLWNIKIKFRAAIEVASIFPGAKKVDAGDLRVYGNVKFRKIQYFNASGIQVEDTNSYEKFMAWGNGTITDTKLGTTDDTDDTDSRDWTGDNNSRFSSIITNSCSINAVTTTPQYGILWVQCEVDTGLTANSSEFKISSDDIQLFSNGNYMRLKLQRKATTGKWKTISLCNRMDVRTSSFTLSSSTGQVFASRPYLDPRATTVFWGDSSGVNNENPYFNILANTVLSTTELTMTGDIYKIDGSNGGGAPNNLYTLDLNTGKSPVGWPGGSDVGAGKSPEQVSDYEINPTTGSAYTDPSQFSTIRLRNGKMKSLSELGLISFAMPFRTINLSAYTHNSTALGYKQNVNSGDRQILDEVYLGTDDPDTKITPFHGINPNASSAPVLNALFENIIPDAGLEGAPLTPITATRLAPLINEFSQGTTTNLIPPRNISHEKRNPKDYGTGWGQTDGKLFNKPSIKLNDREREELLWKTKNLIDGSTYYMVVVAVANGYNIPPSASGIDASKIQGMVKMNAIIKRKWNTPNSHPLRIYVIIQA